MPNKKTHHGLWLDILIKVKQVPLEDITLNHKFTLVSFGFAKRYRRMAGDFNDQMDYSEVFADIDLNPNFKLIANLKEIMKIIKMLKALLVLNMKTVA